MLAAIDAGSNTFRLLIGRVADGKVIPELYLRRICRLAGELSSEGGLSPAARKRALFAFMELAEACRQSDVQKVRVVGTAAFRQAINGEAFVAEIREATRLPLEIISGDEEAEYMATGVLSALDPMPPQALIVDIGGGSTEFVLCLHQKVVWSRSLSLGVVRLTEEFTSSSRRQKIIDRTLAELTSELVKTCHALGIDFSGLTLIGTAGTVTTLAALDMQMAEYDWQRVNNYYLPFSRIQHWQSMLISLNTEEREALPGIESGRGDLILSGLEIMLCLMQQINTDSLTVSDFGILEGLLISLHNEVSHS
ncbi:MAG: exopolyphosphatase [Desulfuromonadales bacterium]|nr:exopolyphosphatase [Desulfuromonadales bacterium]